MYFFYNFLVQENTLCILLTEKKKNYYNNDDYDYTKAYKVLSQS